MIAAYSARNALQSYLAASKDPIAFLSEVAKVSDLASFTLLTRPYLLVNDPALIKEALVDHSDTLIIKGGASAGLARLIGHGILTNHGDDWKTSRAGLQPLFHQNVMRAALPAM